VHEKTHGIVPFQILKKKGIEIIIILNIYF